MNTAGRVYVLSAAIVLAAMVDRLGWIDWQAASLAAIAALTTVAWIIGGLIFVGVVIGLPLSLLAAFTMGLIALIRLGSARTDYGMVRPPSTVRVEPVT